MSAQKPYPDKSWQELADYSGVAAGNAVEGTRRLVVAVDRLNRSTTGLTVVMIVLMVVQIVVAVALVKAGR